MKRRRTELELEVALSVRAERLVAEAKYFREQADKCAADARTINAQAARLLKKNGFSLRESADLLGVSHVMVSKLLAGKKR